MKSCDDLLQKLTDWFHSPGWNDWGQGRGGLLDDIQHPRHAGQAFQHPEIVLVCQVLVNIKPFPRFTQRPTLDRH